MKTNNDLNRRKKSLKRTVSVGLVVINLATVCAFIFQKRPPSTSEFLVYCLAICLLNGMILGLFYLGLKGLKTAIPLDSDRKLKEQKSSLVLKCPNCRKRTIILNFAIHTPQTCGECGKQFFAKKSWLKDFCLILLLFLLLAVMLYLKETERLSTGNLGVVVGLYIVGIYLTRNIGISLIESKRNISVTESGRD